MDVIFVKQGEYVRGDEAFPVLAGLVKEFLELSGRHDIDVSAVTQDVIRRTPEGRPCCCISGAPDISVTHSDDLWMCLVSDERCGLDFQYMREQYIPGVVERFYTEGEREYIEGGGTGQFTGSFLRTEEGRVGRFFDVWVRREALGKYDGHGFFGNYPDSAPGGILADSVYFIRENTVESRQVYMHEITPGMLKSAGIKPEAGFRAAAVTRSDELPLIKALH